MKSQDWKFRRWDLRCVCLCFAGVLIVSLAQAWSSPSPLLTTFQPIEASAVQGSLEVFEEPTGLVVYASISAGPTGTYEVTLTDGHCDPLFAQAKSRPSFLGRGKPLAAPMVLHFVREPVGVRAVLGFQTMELMQNKTVIVERLENAAGRVLSACGQLRGKSNLAWAENGTPEDQRKHVGSI
jgi:hypothetical protein